MAPWSPLFKDSPPKSWVWANLEARTVHAAFSQLVLYLHIRQGRCPLVNRVRRGFHQATPPRTPTQFSSVPLLFLSATPAAPSATRLPDSSIRTVFLLPRPPPSRKLIRTMAPSFYSLFPGNISENSVYSGRRPFCTSGSRTRPPLWRKTCTSAPPYRQSSVILRR